MSTNEKKSRRTFDREYIQSAVKLVASEGYSLSAAAKAVNVSYPTLRQGCQKTCDSEWAGRRQGQTQGTEGGKSPASSSIAAGWTGAGNPKKATAHLAKESQ
jgi:transposase-like protein